MRKGYLPCALFASMITSCVFATSAFAVNLPVLSTFDTDTIGLSPTTGGANQPSGIYLIGNNDPTLLVASQSNGIDTQPIVATISELFGSQADVHAAMAEYSFSAITDGIIRFESTVSFDQVDYAYFMYTLNSEGFATTSIDTNNSGEITMNDSVIIGTFDANSPFRVRMDVNLTNQAWSVSVDNELDGFSDDQVISGTQFLNHQGNLDVATVRFGAERGVIPPEGLILNVAHDNIYISAIPIPASLWLFGTGLLGLVGIARHKKTA